MLAVAPVRQASAALRGPARTAPPPGFAPDTGLRARFDQRYGHGFGEARVHSEGEEAREEGAKSRVAGREVFTSAGVRAAERRQRAAAGLGPTHEVQRGRIGQVAAPAAREAAPEVAPAAEAPGGGEPRAEELAVGLEESLAGAVDVLNAGRRNALRTLGGSAASARRNVGTRVAADKRRFETAWNALDDSVARQIATEQEALTTDYQTRLADAATRTGESVDYANGLFADHRPNIDEAVEDGIREADDARLRHRGTLEDQYESDNQQVREIGEQERSRFGWSDRDLAQRVGVRFVENKACWKMDEQLPDSLGAIDELFEDLPDQIRDGGEQALEGYDEEQPNIIRDIEGLGEDASLSVKAHAQTAQTRLTMLQSDARVALDNLHRTGRDRFDSIETQAAGAIDGAERAARATTITTERRIRRQFQQMGGQAAMLLRDAQEPDLEEAETLAGDLSGYFGEAAGYTAGEMETDAGQSSRGFWNVAREAAATSGGEFTDDQGRMTEIERTASAELIDIADQRAGNLQDVADDLETTLGDQDAELAEQFEGMVQQFRDNVTETIESLDPQVTEAVQEGLDANQEAISEVREAMREEADDAAWQYDHPVLSTLRDIAYAVLGILAGILIALAIVVAAILIFKGAVALLVLAGVSATVATWIVAIGMIAVAVGGVYAAFSRRRRRGESTGEALLGAVGDLTGITEIAHAFTNPYDTPFERGVNFGRGLATLASIPFGGRISRGVDRILVTRLPWLLSRAGFRPAAAGMRQVGRALAHPETIERGLLINRFRGWWQARFRPAAAAEGVSAPRAPAEAPRLPEQAAPAEAPRLPEPAAPAEPTAAEAPLARPRPRLRLIEGGGEGSTTAARPRLRVVGEGEAEATEAAVLAEAEQAAEATAEVVAEEPMRMAAGDEGRAFRPRASASSEGGAGGRSGLRAPQAPRERPGFVRRRAGGGGRGPRRPAEPAPEEPELTIAEEIASEMRELSRPEQPGVEHFLPEEPVSPAETARGAEVPPPAEMPAVREQMHAMGRQRGRQELFRELVQESNPETIFQRMNEAHHIVEKRGGGLLMDVLREVVEVEGIEVATDPINAVPLPRAGRGEARGVTGALTSHGPLHTTRYQESVLGEVVRQDPLASAESLAREVLSFDQAMRAQIRAELAAIPRPPTTPDQSARIALLERTLRGPLTRLKLERAGLLEEGTSLLGRFGVRTDSLDVAGTLRGIARLLEEGRFDH